VLCFLLLDFAYIPKTTHIVIGTETQAGLCAGWRRRYSQYFQVSPPELAGTLEERVEVHESSFVQLYAMNGTKATARQPKAQRIHLRNPRRW